MRFLFLQLGFFLCISGAASAQTASQEKGSSQIAANTAQGSVVVDSIIEKIEDDVITESQVSELQAFQKLLGEAAKSRDEVIQELTDQWMIANEAQNSPFLAPSPEANDRAFGELVQKFPSPDAFRKRLAEVGLTEAAAKRLVAQELYLTGFLEFKFRPVAQIEADQVQAYYEKSLVPELKARSEAIPPLASVEDQIREVLTQKSIDQASSQWLEETRSRLRIEPMSPEAGE